MGRIGFVEQYLGAEKILDIGCAANGGLWHKRIQKLTSGKVWGVDIDINGLKQMKAPRLTCANVQYLPFSDGEFDLVIMGELLEHLWDPMSALLEAWRVLKRDGMLVVTTPNAYSLNRILSYTIRKQVALGAADHKTIFTPEALIKLMYRCGFEPVKNETCRKFQVPFTSRVVVLNFGILNHLGQHICLAAKKIDPSPSVE